MRRPVKSKEEIAESCCFFCKDGGFLRICDYKNCLKAYHPQCVKKDDSFLETNERWSCGWHYCFICGKSAKFQCFSCPAAVCGRCLCDSEFAVVRRKFGLCNYCLELGLLLEDTNFAVSNKLQRIINFDDTETYEYFFKCYWEVIKKTEGLTLQHLRSAHGLLKRNKNYESESDTNEKFGRVDDAEFQVDISDSSSDQTGRGSKRIHKRKRADGWLSGNARKRKEKLKKKEFLGWASKSLLDFLQSVGKDTSSEMSESDVATVITEYCKEQKLFHPKNRKKVNCDKRLQLLFGKKSFSRNSIYKLLQVHFAESAEESEEAGDSFRENDEEPHNMISDQNSEEKESQNCFASIVPGNIKLIYLKRSVVEELVKQLDTFESKIIGSFVRIKSDPNDCFQRNPRQLVQVTGIKRARTGQVNPEIFLQVSNVLKEVSIFDLLDDDFTEEECQDLCQRMKDGLLMRPTVGEVQEKARILHEDITKHWIAKEIMLLQRRIDQANEKGWRRELYDYIDKKQLLMHPPEQSRLLQEIPVVIADRDELEAVSKSPSKKDQHGQGAWTETTFEIAPETPRSTLGTSTFWRQHGRDDSGGKQLQPRASVFDEPLHQSDNVPAEADQQQKAVREDRCYSTLSLSELSAKQCSDAVLELEGQPASVTDREQHDGSNISRSRNCQLTTPKTPLSTGGKLLQPKESVFDKLLHQSDHVPAEADQQQITVRENQHSMLSFSLLLLKQPSAAVLEFEGQPASVHTGKEQHNGGNISRSENCQLTTPVCGKNIALPTAEVIDISDDEEHDGKVAAIKDHPEDLNTCEWYCIGTRGNLMGPHSLSWLKKWSDTSAYKIPYKVFRSGQRPEDAILLTDALCQVSSPAAADQTNEAHQEEHKHVTETASEKKLADLEDGVTGQDRETALSKLMEKQDHCFSIADETWRDPHCKIWFCVCPAGSMMGPHSMTVLKKWHDTSSLDIPYRVLRSGQSPEEAIPLADAINWIFNT